MLRQPASQQDLFDKKLFVLLSKTKIQWQAQYDADMNELAGYASVTLDELETCLNEASSVAIFEANIRRVNPRAPSMIGAFSRNTIKLYLPFVEIRCRKSFAEIYEIMKSIEKFDLLTIAQTFHVTHQSFDSYARQILDNISINYLILSIAPVAEFLIQLKIMLSNINSPMKNYQYQFLFHKSYEIQIENKFKIKHAELCSILEKLKLPDIVEFFKAMPDMFNKLRIADLTNETAESIIVELKALMLAKHPRDRDILSEQPKSASKKSRITQELPQSVAGCQCYNPQFFAQASTHLPSPVPIAPPHPLPLFATQHQNFVISMQSSQPIRPEVPNQELPELDEKFLLSLLNS